MNNSRRTWLAYGLVLMGLTATMVAFMYVPSQTNPTNLRNEVGLFQPSPPVTYTLTVTINPAGGGSVTRNPNLPTYISGTIVTLTANPSSGYTFSSWSGAVSGSTSPITVTMDSNKSVTANFVAIPTCFTLTTAVNPAGAGSVTVNPPSNCSGGRYVTGTVVSLVASPASGYSFSSWTGCDSPSGASCTTTMNSNKSVTANFSITPPPTSTSVPPPTQKWEYLSIVVQVKEEKGQIYPVAVNGTELRDWKTGPTFSGFLTQYGVQGWELVSVAPWGNDREYLCTFKRPRA